jgi:hypothetical protein
MLNGDAIIAQVRQGTWPQSWQVLRANRSHFIRLAIFIAIFLVLAAFGLLYLISNPDHAVVPGAAGSPDGGTLDPATFAVWRTIDLAVLGIALVGLVVAVINTLLQMAHAQEQLLVVLPEGFVLKTRRLQTVAFAAIQTMTATSYRGVVTFKIGTVNGQKLSVSLDARFGAARQVAQRILAARNQFTAAPAAGQG